MPKLKMPGGQTMHLPYEDQLGSNQPTEMPEVADPSMDWGRILEQLAAGMGAGAMNPAIGGIMRPLMTEWLRSKRNGNRPDTP